MYTYVDSGCYSEEEFECMCRACKEGYVRYVHEEFSR